MCIRSLSFLNKTMIHFIHSKKKDINNIDRKIKKYIEEKLWVNLSLRYSSDRRNNIVSIVDT